MLQVETHSFSGPLPHPDVLSGYDNVVPGAAERVIQVFESQSRHRLDLERKVVDAQLNGQRRGQWMAFALALAVLLISTFLFGHGHVAIGTALVVGDLAALAGVFLYVSSQNGRREADDR